MTTPREQTNPLRAAVENQQRQREVMKETAEKIARERQRAQESTEDAKEEA